MKRNTLNYICSLSLCLGIYIFTSLIVAGCDLRTAERPTTCQVGDQTYQAGEAFGDGCNSCQCDANGEVVCTTLACLPGCSVDGNFYDVGESFASDCNTCTCESDNTVVCDTKACGKGCEWDGQHLADGEKVSLGGGCGYCICLGGAVACTDQECGVQCEVDGDILNVGDSFTADDGCSVCTCGADGTVFCTGQACVCSPQEEWFRDYVAGAEECALMDQPMCPDNTTYFSNECGCGCEMSQECPERVNCMPPEDSERCSADFFAKCPYTDVDV